MRGDGGRRAMLGAAEKSPGALAESLHQLRLRQQLEMARYPWLRLAQDFREFRNSEFGFGEKAENAKTGFLPCCLEGGVQIIEADLRIHSGTLPNRLGQDSGPVAVDRHKDIFMQLIPTTHCGMVPARYR